MAHLHQVGTGPLIDPPKVLTMIHSRRIILSICSVFILLTLSVFWYGIGHAAEATSSSGKALLAKYPAMSAKLQKNQFSAPIHLESSELEGSLKVDMYGVFHYPFEVVRAALQTPANWCDITSLHTNIKACTTRKAADQWLLTLYSGRKYYQSPADAYQLKLKFRLAALQPDYLDAVLAAKDGPLGTKDHRIRLEAVPLDKGKTFIHFSYAYRHGPMANMAIKSYFSTIGRDKVGFSVVRGKSGTPVYIGGVRGAVERNTVRYYLALQTYMETLKVPEGQRFEQRLGRWYDHTAKYPRQLKEVEKPEYLDAKRREHVNQLLLQKKEGR